MVMDVERVAETVFLTTRPSYQQTSVYSLVEVLGQRRHKQEIKLQPTLEPVKFADTAFLLLNNTRKRFRSRTFYQPRMNQKSFADTTFANPKTLQERFVSSVDLHSDQQKKKFKTSIEIKPKIFKSSVSYPNIESLSSSHDPLLTNGFSHSNSNGDLYNDVDENMNRRIPASFQEKFDPGASQVFIPKRKDYNFSSSTQDRLLDSVCDQILIDYSGVNDSRNGDGVHSNSNGNLSNGYANLNGHVSDFSDL